MMEFKNYKVYKGKLGKESLLCSLPEDMHRHYRKGDLIRWEPEKVYVIKQVLFDYEAKELNLFVSPYKWPMEENDG